MANLGLLMLATVAKNEGHEVTYFHFPDDNTQISEKLESLLTENEVIGITAMNTTIDKSLQIANVTKKMNPNSIVVIGGPEVTACKTNYLTSSSDVDILFKGECEEIFVDFLEDPFSLTKKKELKGISYKNKGLIVNNPGLNIVDITKLPSPDFTIVPLLDKSQVYLEMSRGCNYHCAFCMEHNNEVRFKTLEQMARDLKMVETVRKNSLLHIMDSNFIYSNKFMNDFEEAIKLSMTTNNFVVQTRIDGISEDRLRKAYANKIAMINFGLDNLSDNVLKGVNKNLTWGKIQEGLKIARKIAPTPLSYRGNFIQGLPFETVDDAHINILRRRYLLENDLLYSYRDYVFMPVSGSPIYEAPKHFGLNIKKRSSFRNDIPGYDYFQPKPRSAEEIYLHHLAMRLVVNDFFINKYNLHELISN